jgi:hypothetical protein
MAGQRIGFIILTTALFATPVLARPPPPGSEDAAIMKDYAEWVTGQHAPSGQYCCDLSDGRPLKPDEIRSVNGHYEVLYTKRHWDYGTEEWLEVPKEALLPQLSPVGYPIVWIFRGRVYCFAQAGAV